MNDAEKAAAALMELGTMSAEDIQRAKREILDREMRRAQRQLASHPVRGWEHPASRLTGPGSPNWPKATVPGRVRRARNRERADKGDVK